VSKSLLIALLVAGALLAPIGLAASMTRKWADRFLIAGALSVVALVWVVLNSQEDDYTRVVSEQRAQVQRVERAEPRMFVAGFQQVLLDGRPWAVTDAIELEEKQIVTIRVVRHKYFRDTRTFVCVEERCSAAQPVEG
jgi:hypothetical protein